MGASKRGNSGSCILPIETKLAKIPKKAEFQCVSQYAQAILPLRESAFNIDLGSGFSGSRLLRSRYQPSFFIMGILRVSTNSISVPSGSSMYVKCPAASPISNPDPPSTVNG